MTQSPPAERHRRAGPGPAGLDVTVEPDTEHTAESGGSMLNVTVLPDPPPVAVTL